ncbi:hypothetical protein PIB30_063734 [Stylosanthes scabra]|uniref:Uncharacterized protein n=1 Tax=Stylosanthes scabra TaxID=79078 RepID=A0ABU6YJ14_9FABA|nr:hypothetical protein [Stylosanthes scabra]
MGACVRTIHHDFPRGHKDKCARDARKLKRMRHVSIKQVFAIAVESLDICRDAAVQGIDDWGNMSNNGLPCGCEWFGGVITKTVATDRVFEPDVDGQPSQGTPTNNKVRVVNPQVPGSRMFIRSDLDKCTKSYK